MPMRDWPPQERPRERLLARGPSALSDAELLAIVLGSGAAGGTAVDLARDVLARLGGLRAALEAERRDVLTVRGFGPAKYAALQACLELGRRYLEARMRRGGSLASPADTRRFLEARLRGYGHEVFACLYLDNRHRIIRFEELFHGTIDGAAVHPREIVKRALAHNAAALIVAHNHPSGIAEPSQADHSLTRRLVDATGLMGLRLLDHVIIGDGAVVSFAERGWL